MSNKNWRIFLSYRGGTEGQAFSERLYNYLMEDPMSKDKYGDIFYSIITGKLGDSYKYDIPSIMKHCSYFVMPLTKEYFADFWDEQNNCPDKNSITYLEIKAALEFNCRFICIPFPGFELDESLLKKLFNNDSDKISCQIPRPYIQDAEEEIFREIGDVMVRNDYNVCGISEYINSWTPNVYLSFKRNTEDSNQYPFYQKLHDVRHITLLNFAASSFITGIDIASIYSESDYMKRWFTYHLSKGDIEVDIIITDPHSNAAEDAAQYKMYPAGLKVERNEIILHNMNCLFAFMRKYPSAKLNIYLTRIALPYGVMMTEYNNAKNNHIKIDLYSAVTDDDGLRPSFYLLKQNTETDSLYSFFCQNVRRIMSNYSYRFNGHPPIEWLKQRHIIHRGLIRRGLLPHTKNAFDICLANGYPIEVDLLQMRDGTIIVARDDQNIAEYGYTQKLSELEKNDLRAINRKSGINKVLTFEEFLDYIGGKIPVLIEIKTKSKDLSPAIKKYVTKIVHLLHNYKDHYTNCFRLKYQTNAIGFAVHSADPNVLSIIKEMDCMIPCGIITKDFTPIKDVVGEGFCRCHLEGTYTNIVIPDFISADINFLQSSKIATQLAEKLDIPLLAWTITNEKEELFADDYGCDNVIVEGATGYIQLK